MKTLYLDEKANLELEGNVIGSMILDNKFFIQAQDKGLQPSDFTVLAYQKTYEIMLEKQGIDIISLQDLLNKQMFEKVRLATAEGIILDDISSWIKLMQDATANRKLLTLAKRIPDIVNQDTKIEEKISKINEHLIGDRITKATGSPKKISQIFDSVEHELSNANEINKNLIKTGFQTLDNKIKGFRSGDLVIIAGRPAMGKTTFALNIATNSVLQGKNVLLFSLEMTNEQLLKKIISAQAELSMDSLLTGNLDLNGWDKFRKMKSFFEEKNMFVYDRSPITIETLVNKTKTLQAVMDIDLIVVDYLQLLMTSNKAPSNSDSRASSISYISNLLKGLAKDIQCPLISLSQLSRGVEGRTDKRPVLSDLRDSGSIEQDADMVIMLYRDEYYDSLSNNTAEIIIRKNRLGDSGQVELGFNGAYSKFLDPDEVAFGRREEEGPI
jgi:replicative DNA helicase|tara:strand:+ start:3385 stop:4707 length:1323 start_codon:yes stop_codon:yes gene_type:complete